MKVCVVGLGYIGLPTAVVMAESGLEVYGYDINREHIERIESREIDIREEGLSEMLERTLKAGKLRVGTAIEEGDVFVIAVSTSLDAERMTIDLGPLKNASRTVGKVLKKDNLVIVESTVIPGVTENIVKPILEDESGLECPNEFLLAYCPERVLPGNLMHELVDNDRIIGGIDEASRQRAITLYSRFVRGRLYPCDLINAEMAKLMENTYRAVNIALANEFALIAEKIGADVWKAIEMANNHPRVHIHLPGPGVGGYCLTKDPWFLISDFKDSRVIKEAMAINDAMPKYIAKMVIKALKQEGKKIEDCVVAILGIAYKGNVSDARESPGYKVYSNMVDKFRELRVHDPYVREYMGLRPLKDLKRAVNGADVVVVTTDHRDYMAIDWNELTGLMNKPPIIVDTKNIVPKGDFILVKLGCRNKYRPLEK